MWFLVAMGVIGRKLGTALGKALGGFAGKKLGKFTGMGQNEGQKIGEDIGGDAGDLLPFKKGGRVKKNGKIYAHKGEFVLQYRPNDNVKAKTKFLANGKFTDKSKLVDFLPTENHATNQGTDREILWRKLYLKNVRKIAVNGEVYKVIG